MSHRASLLGRGYSDHHLDSPRVRFRRALLLCLMTVLVPGSGHIAAGKRWLGWTAVMVWLATLVGGGFLLFTFRTDRAQVLDWFSDTDVLMAARIALVTGVVLWIALFADAWRLGSPFRLSFGRAAVITLLNLAIIGGVAGSTAYASQFIKASRDTVIEVFPDDVPTSDPLKGRYNILLVGSDARADRTGVRPDTLVVASVDAGTGKVVLVSLPRNLEKVPFPEDSPMRQLYPYGFNCANECLLNAVHTVASDRPDLYPGSDDPGLEATIDAVEGATDLKINYFIMVNLNGFKGLVDAVGGVEMDVKTRIAMFGTEDAYKQKYLEVGRRELDGQEALWYARSRYGSDDYTRMGRQKCLMAAMADQLSPAKVLMNATQIAKSGKELLSTSIPRKELGQFADLALKSRGNKIRTVSIVPPKFSNVNPDFDEIHGAIQKAIDASEGVAKPPAAPASPSSPTATEDPTARAANNVDDLQAAC